MALSKLTKEQAYGGVTGSIASKVQSSGKDPYLPTRAGATAPATLRGAALNDSVAAGGRINGLNKNATLLGGLPGSTQKEIGNVGSVGSPTNLDETSRLYGAGVIPDNWTSRVSKQQKYNDLAHAQEFEQFKNSDTVKSDPYSQELLKRYADAIKYNNEGGSGGLAQQITDRAKVLYESSTNKQAADAKAKQMAAEEQMRTDNTNISVTQGQQQGSENKPATTWQEKLDQFKQLGSPTQAAKISAQQNIQQQPAATPQQPAQAQGVQPTTPFSRTQAEQHGSVMPTQQPVTPKVNPISTIKNDLSQHYDEPANQELSVVESKTNDLDLDTKDGIDKLELMLANVEAKAQERDEKFYKLQKDNADKQFEIQQSQFDARREENKINFDAQRQQASTEKEQKRSDAMRRMMVQGQFETDDSGNYDASSEALIQNIGNEAQKYYDSKLSQISKEERTAELDLQMQENTAMFNYQKQMSDLSTTMYTNKSAREDKITNALVDLQKAQLIKEMDIAGSLKLEQEKQKVEKTQKKYQIVGNEKTGYYKVDLNDEDGTPIALGITESKEGMSALTNEIALSPQNYNVPSYLVKTDKDIERFEKKLDYIAKNYLSPEELAAVNSGDEEATNDFIRKAAQMQSSFMGFQDYNEPLAQSIWDNTMMLTGEDKETVPNIGRLLNAGKEEEAINVLEKGIMKSKTVDAKEMEQQLTTNNVLNLTNKILDVADMVPDDFVGPIEELISKKKEYQATSNYTPEQKKAIDKYLTYATQLRQMYSKPNFGTALTGTEIKPLMDVFGGGSVSKDTFKNQIQAFMEVSRDNLNFTRGLHGLKPLELVVDNNVIRLQSPLDIYMKEAIMNEETGKYKKKTYSPMTQANNTQQTSQPTTSGSWQELANSAGTLNPDAMTSGEGDTQGFYGAIEQSDIPEDIKTAAKVTYAFEGYRPDAYYDKAGKTWTIGAGSTTGVKEGDKTDLQTAVQKMYSHMAGGKQSIDKTITQPLTTNQNAALHSVLYNHGNALFDTPRGKELAKAINSGDRTAIEKAWMDQSMWTAKGVPNNVLHKRRAQELELFLR